MKINLHEFTLTPIANSALACSGGRLVTEDDSKKEAKCKIFTLVDECDIFYLIFIDCLYIGKDLKEKIVKILRGLPGKLLFVSASHSHSLPNLSQNHSCFGNVNKKYLGSLFIGLSDFVEAYSSLSFEAIQTVYVETLSSKNVTLRRHFLRRPFLDVTRVLKNGNIFEKKLKLTFGGIVMFPSKENTKDSLGISMNIETNDRCINFMSVFVHPTNIKYGCSRDIYSLFEKNCLDEGREFVGSHGFGADLKLYMEKRKGLNIKRFFRNLLLGPKYPILNEDDLKKIVQESSFKTVASYKSTGTCGDSKVRTFEVSGDIGVRDKFSPVQYKFKVIYVGKLVLVSANCEVSSNYYEELSLLISKDCFLFPVSCSDECVGYMPHYNHVGQGGYEDSKFIQYFGLSGQIDKQKLIALVDRLKMLLKGN